ncbi:hypothetical protein NC99_22590 [Sunxiuqinia dokdonensis]|uniref:Uncharacterized protein n=1 Tax=Sunxiuqinia dokdonensis TaxID=1409788 RepID=A0A0L8V9Q7_9BACT|nr:hypothetical protein NC99_22590 [Sunxiuqinia dokdonensis]
MLYQAKVSWPFKSSFQHVNYSYDELKYLILKHFSFQTP